MSELNTTHRRLAGGGIVLAWCAVVAVAATAGWVVVDRAGVSLLGASGPGLSGGVAAGATPTATTVAGRVASLATAGGPVTATCPAARSVSLQSATPAQGWQVEVAASGPAQLRVEFRRSGHKVEVTGVCRAGVAALSARTSTSGTGTSVTAPARTRSTPSPSTTDDHGGTTKGGDSSGHSSGGSSGSSSVGSSGGGSGDSGGSGRSGGNDGSSTTR
jgi:uncharacterized membrane protein YgcG